MDYSVIKLILNTQVVLHTKLQRHNYSSTGQKGIFCIYQSYSTGTIQLNNRSICIFLFLQKLWCELQEKESSLYWIYKQISSPCGLCKEQLSNTLLPTASAVVLENTPEGDIAWLKTFPLQHSSTAGYHIHGHRNYPKNPNSWNICYLVIKMHTSPVTFPCTCSFKIRIVLGAKRKEKKKDLPPPFN